MTEQGKILSDQIEVEWRGDRITVWNHLTVQKHHDVMVGQTETYHQVLAGDGSTGERPEFITPAMDDKLHRLDVYPDVRVIDPMDDDVVVL